MRVQCVLPTASMVQMIDGGSSQPQNVLGVTALNGDGVEEGIRWLVDEVRASPRAIALSGGEGWAYHRRTAPQGPVWSIAAIDHAPI